MTTTNLADVLRTHAATIPDKTALIQDDRIVSFGELHDRSNRVATGLTSEGIGHGDHIGFLDKNSIEFFDFLFGAAKIGAVHAGINWRLTPSEMEYVINDAGSKLLVVGQEYVPALEEIEDRLVTVERILVIGGHERHEDFDNWRDRHAAEDPGGGAIESDTVFLLYSSGTTGFPKGILVPNDGFFRLVHHGTKAWKFDRDSVNLVNLPMFHIGGVGWSGLGMINGNTSVIVRDNEPALLVDVMSKRGVTNAFLVPVLLQFMIDVPGVMEADWSALRLLLYGGAPISESVLRTSISVFGCEFAGSYGLTESTNGVTTLSWKDHDLDGPNTHRLLSIGLPHPNVELKIVDPVSFSDLPPGEVGEIWIKSDQVMKSYWNNPEATKETLRADGWLRTGDAGSVDEDGYAYIQDRIKDMIISGGENIYPAELENALMEHPDVSDVAVIGVPHEIWGETPKALVVLVKNATASPDHLLEHCRSLIASYKCPKSVEFRDVIPRNASGKILKNELRAPYWEQLDRKV